MDPVAVDLLNYVDPDATGNRMIFSTELLAAAGVSRARLSGALANLTTVLEEGVLISAEIKGALNRASNRTWGIEYERRFTPREFLEELKSAIEICLRTRDSVR